MSSLRSYFIHSRSSRVMIVFLVVTVFFAAFFGFIAMMSMFEAAAPELAAAEAATSSDWTTSILLTLEAICGCGAWSGGVGAWSASDDLKHVSRNGDGNHGETNGTW